MMPPHPAFRAIPLLFLFACATTGRYTGMPDPAGAIRVSGSQIIEVDGQSVHPVAPSMFVFVTPDRHQIIEICTKTKWDVSSTRSESNLSISASSREVVEGGYVYAFHFDTARATEYRLSEGKVCWEKPGTGKSKDKSEECETPDLGREYALALASGNENVRRAAQQALLREGLPSLVYLGKAFENKDIGNPGKLLAIAAMSELCEPQPVEVSTAEQEKIRTDVSTMFAAAGGTDSLSGLSGSGLYDSPSIWSPPSGSGLYDSPSIWSPPSRWGLSQSGSERDPRQSIIEMAVKGQIAQLEQERMEKERTRAQACVMAVAMFSTLSEEDSSPEVRAAAQRAMGVIGVRTYNWPFLK